MLGPQNGVAVRFCRLHSLTLLLGGRAAQSFQLRTHHHPEAVDKAFGEGCSLCCEVFVRSVLVGLGWLTPRLNIWVTPNTEITRDDAGKGTDPDLPGLVADPAGSVGCGNPVR